MEKLSKEEAVQELLAVFEEMDPTEIDEAVADAKGEILYNLEQNRKLNEYFKTHSTQKSRGCIAK
ncbi:hypothetical protein HY839_03280 [Candidatus Azambacteria bacterium]|nr:hypothetical protein [Candidatus Azambacteria bacterium]